MGFGAVNTGNNLLYIIVSFLLSIMALSGFLGVSNLKNIQVKIVHPDEIYAGNRSEVRVKISKPNRVARSYLITAIIEGVNTSFPVVDSKNQEGKIFITPLKRGFYTLERCIIESTFPFNFFIRRKIIPLDFKFIVFPSLKIYQESVVTDYHKNEKLIAHLNISKEGGEEINRTREYQIGDLKRNIMWKHYAKTGRLMVKIYESTKESGNMVCLKDILGSLETKLSCATYLIVTSLKNNINVGLETPKGKFSPGNSALHKIQMLRHLALYED